MVYRNAKPPADNPHRDKLFDLLLSSKTTSGKKRRAVLTRSFRGSVTSDSIDLYINAKSDETATRLVQEWAKETASALVPRAHRVFARHRWLTGFEGSIDDITLLAVINNILPRAIPLWLQSLGQLPKGNQKDDVGGMDPGDLQIVLHAGITGARAPDVRTAWAEMNASARVDTKSLGEAKPAVDLLVFRVCLGPLVALMDRFLHEGSEQWDREQEYLASQGKQRQYRVLNAYRGVSVKKFWKQMRLLLLSEDDSWAVLAPHQRTYQSSARAFASSCRSMAGVDHFVGLPQSQYPFKWFALLIFLDPESTDEEREKVLESIFRELACALDPFSKRFKAMFPTRAALCGPNCLVTLLCIAILFRLCVSRIECRHAAVRRLLLALTRGLSFPGRALEECPLAQV